MPDTLLSPSGEPINAIKGFLDMSARLINQYQPSRLVACLEGDWRPSWRVELFPGYKANRVDESGEEEEPDTLGPQIPILLDILEAFGIPMLGVDDYEADDIMASFSVKERGPTFVATGDRDLFQLVDDKRRVKIVYLAKGVSNHDLVDRNWINNRYEIPGDRYALFAMVRGDASDGLPGVRGIGGEGSEYIAIAPKLVHCALDVPIPSMSIEMPRRPNSMETIWKYKEEYGLGSSIDRMVSALKW
jgi:5'-3' exonuclease